MAQEAPETVRLSKEAKAAVKRAVAKLQAKSPVKVSRNAAINLLIIAGEKQID